MELCFYPLDRNGAGDLTGLSEILHLRDRTYAAIERDGKGGKRSIKWITTFDLAPGAGADPDSRPPLLVKRRARDLVPLFLAEDRKVEKEVEGLAMAADGEIYAVTDNDNERATVLLRLGSVDDPIARGLNRDRRPALANSLKPELLGQNPLVEIVAGVEHHEEIDRARLLDLDA